MLASMPPDTLLRLSKLGAWLPLRQSWQLLATTAQLLFANLWAIVALYAFRDAAAFVLHRVSQRLTNHSE